MTIPNPTPEGVAKFKQLYRELKGEELDDDTAQDLATRFLHFAFFGLTVPPKRENVEPEPENAVHKESLSVE